MPAHRVLRQHELGLAVLLVSLTVFFTAALFAFVIVRPAYPSAGAVPSALWASTLALVAGAVLQHRALTCVRRERQAAFRRLLTASLVVSLVFVLLQAWGMWQLVVRHLAASDAPPVWLLLFCLVAIHGAHVLVGVIALTLVVLGSWRGRFDHEFHLHVTLCIRYWRFLDIVWLAMLAVFVLAGR